MDIKTRIATAALAFTIPLSASAVPIMTDVISLVDESGSMDTEHAWIGGMMTSLDSELQAAAGGDTFDVRYGLTGFGSSRHTSDQSAHKHSVGGGDLGTATEFDTASDSLFHQGGTEDGYQAIHFANDNYSLRSNVLTNFILITDEDRDNVNGNSFDYDNTLTLLNDLGALLNAAVNATFHCESGSGAQALGVDADGTGYVADGLGGFTTCSNAVATSGDNDTIEDYVDLALATGGAAWDLNQLRAGGLTADSFTNAFVKIKTKETIENPPTPVPEPGTLALLGLGLAGLAFRKSRVSTKA